MNLWLLLIISLPTENATARMRAWRTLKATGSAVLRDGVYLMPDRTDCRATFDSIAQDITTAGGSAHVLRAEEPLNAKYPSLFDRSQDYASLLDEIHQIGNDLKASSILSVTKQIRKLRKAFTVICETDFFPGATQQQTDRALLALEAAVNRLLSPNEPTPVDGEIKKLLIQDYQGKVWATRCRPWVDRLASAWLIRRFIDQKARFIWLDNPDACPADALGFDFDNATFTHVGNKVTYEVLLASFSLAQPALQRIGALVHYIDVGGVQPAEAIGVESVLAGLRENIQDDDQLLAMASSVFDGLLVNYEKIDSK